MPSRKKKYNARFPAGRIKKIMQMDDDVGKIAHAVPVLISRSVELFVNSLLQQTATITRERNAKTLSLTHTKHCILREKKFDFLKDLVKNIDDVSAEEEKRSSRIVTSTTMSQPDELEKPCEIASEPLLDESTPALLNGDKKLTKRRYSSDAKCDGPDSKKLFENQSTSSSCGTVRLISTSGNHSFDDTQLKSESFSSCDLIIDEDSET